MMAWTNPKCVKCMAKIKNEVILYKVKALGRCKVIGDSNVCPAGFQEDKKCPFKEERCYPLEQ